MKKYQKLHYTISVIEQVFQVESLKCRADMSPILTKKCHKQKQTLSFENDILIIRLSTYSVSNNLWMIPKKHYR